MTDTPCGYVAAANHSDDRVTVYAGRVTPVTLCGYHATPEWIGTALAGVTA